jgi:integrase
LSTGTCGDTTLELYKKLLKSITPTFGEKYLADITPQAVQRWYGSLKATPTMRANSYGLLKSIFKDAVKDQLIERNPCLVRAGSSKTRVKEPVALTADELTQYIAAVPAKYRVPLLLAGWCALRSGEVRGLRRRDLDLQAGVVRVEQQAVKVGNRYELTKPKTDAGTRTVAIPPSLLPALREWLKALPVTGQDDLLFTGRDGGPMSASSLRDAHVVGRDAVKKPSFTVHGLRHTGLTLAAQSGATVAELMARAGHTTPTMALQYQHSSQERDTALAARMSAMASGVVHL